MKIVRAKGIWDNRLFVVVAVVYPCGSPMYRVMDPLDKRQWYPYLHYVDSFDDYNKLKVHKTEWAKL